MKLTMTGMEQLRARMDRLRGNLENLEPAFLRSAVVILDAAKRRIQTEDSGNWFISKAMADNPKGTPLHRTGRLFNSLTVGASDGLLQDITGGISVGTNVNYAAWLQDGTQAHERGSPLSTKQGPRARASGGMPPRRFLYVDEQLAEGVKKVFVAHLFGGAL